MRTQGDESCVWTKSQIMLLFVYEYVFLQLFKETPEDHQKDQKPAP